MAKMTRQEILERFEEAVYTAKRLPPVIIPGCKAVWPDIIYTPLEILQQEKCPIRLRPSPEQLSRLDEVLSWTPLLTELERKLIWYKAQRKPWKFICTALGISCPNKAASDLTFVSFAIGFEFAAVNVIVKQRELSHIGNLAKFFVYSRNNEFGTSQTIM